MPVQSLTKYYRNTGLEAGRLQALRNVINSGWLNWGHRRHGYRLYYASECVEVDAAKDIPTIVAERGDTTKHFTYFESTTGRKVELDATKQWQVRLFVLDRSSNRDVLRLMKAFEDALSLVPLETFVSSAFVAHGFDEKGQGYANELKYFLQLLGITVHTGKNFAPESVSEKVKGRMAKADVLFAVLTPQEDPTWITQEITRADALKKTPFILKQNDAHLKAGLLGDREYISFQDGHISEAFIPILEGLRDLRGDPHLG